MHILHNNVNKFILLLHRIITILKLKDLIMINVFNFFNKFYEDITEKNYSKDEDLVKYFKSEYGKEWKIELDKYLLKTEFDINKKAA